MRTDLTEEGANSTLSVAKINKSDSGNYTCKVESSIGPTYSFCTTVHVLNGKLIWPPFFCDQLSIEREFGFVGPFFAVVSPKGLDG